MASAPASSQSTSPRLRCSSARTAHGTFDDLFAIQGTQQLAPTYRQLVPTRPVLDGVVQELNLPYSWETLRDKIFASTVADSQILTVSASDPDPQLAATIANAIARHFSDAVARLALDLAAPRRAQLDRSITAYDRRIADAEARCGRSMPHLPLPIRWCGPKARRWCGSGRPTCGTSRPDRQA
jgi:hypothetical protein